MRRGCLSLVALFVAIAFIFSSSGVGLAATDAAQGLQISPVIINLNADKGKAYTLKISVLNVTTGNLVFNSYVNDFQAKDETGNPNVLLDSNLPPTASIISWVKPIGQLDIKSGATKDLNVTVSVPANAESGGHYGVIRFSGAAPEQQKNGVALAASAGILVLVRVSGDVTEDLKLADFFTARGDKRTSMFATGPVTFVQRINNTGNVHVAPMGDVVVTNMFGKNAGTLKVNPTRGNILPNSIRRFDEKLNKKWLFGKYTASVNLAYGTQGKVLIASTTFWVIPWLQIVIGLALLILLILVLRLALKRYNKRIIDRASAQPPSDPNQNHPAPPAAPAPPAQPNS